MNEEIINLVIAVDNLARKIEYLTDKVDQLVALSSMDKDLRSL